MIHTAAGNFPGGGKLQLDAALQDRTTLHNLLR